MLECPPVVDRIGGNALRAFLRKRFWISGGVLVGVLVVDDVGVDLLVCVSPPALFFFSMVTWGEKKGL